MTILTELTDAAVEKIRKDFPLLQTHIHGKPLIYFDTAASAQKPQCVIDAIVNLYTHHYANVHRGVHTLSEQATHLFEQSRDKVRDFINAKYREEIIFTRGTTEAINAVAACFVKSRLHPGDEVLITAMEHHANIVPWQMICEARGALLKVAPINDAGELLLDVYESLLTPRTRMVSVVHMSNALGTINPLEKIISLAHAKNIPVLVDGAQAVCHQKLDMQQLDCDFYTFSSHKLYGPTGIGVLYGKKQWLEEMPPYQGGGEMISRVTFEKTTYNVLPYKFEGGTPHIDGAVGLGAAIDYIQKIGLDAISAYEKKLLAYATQQILHIPDIRIIGTAREKTSILSFVFDKIHAHDVGTILDQEGIAVRTGHHCTMPLMQRLGVAATTRASLAFYNTKAEIDIFLNALEFVKKVFN